MSKLKIVLLILLAAVFSSCGERLEGNRNVVTLTRTPGQPITGVLSKGSFQVEIIPDTVYKVVLNGESNILEHLSTIVSKGQLFLEYQDAWNIKTHYPVIVRVHTPALDFVTLNGSGSITSGHFEANDVFVGLSGSGSISCGFSANTFKANVSGSGKINVSGDADQSTLEVDGSGRIDALDLTQNHCFAKISGSGKIYTFVNDLLDVRISGSGTVYYQGNPATINQQISGSGKVVKY